MARSIRVSEKTGLSRIEMLGKIQEIKPSFDRKANFTRVEKSYLSLVEGKSTTKARTPKTSKPRQEKLTAHIDGKDVKISKYTLLSYKEMRDNVKKTNPNFKSRKHEDIENEFIVQEYNRLNPTRTISNMNELELKQPSKAYSDSVQDLRDFSKYISSPTGESPVVNASKSLLTKMYGVERNEFIKDEIEKSIKSILPNQDYDDNDVATISNLIDSSTYQVKTSNIIGMKYDYVNVVKTYFNDKNEKDNEKENNENENDKDKNKRIRKSNKIKRRGK